jgi:hypothetical protein
MTRTRYYLREPLHSSELENIGWWYVDGPVTYASNGRYHALIELDEEGYIVWFERGSNTDDISELLATYEVEVEDEYLGSCPRCGAYGDRVVEIPGSNLDHCTVCDIAFSDVAIIYENWSKQVRSNAFEEP